MAFFTNRDYIKPVFFCVAVPVVVFNRFIRTIVACSGFGAWHFAYSNSIAYGATSFYSLRELLSIFSAFLSVFNFYWAFALVCFFGSMAMSAVAVFYICFFRRFFTFFCSYPLFVILRNTHFALSLASIFFSATFVKFRKWLKLLALVTFLKYDLLRHNRFSSKRFCLEPVAA